MGQVQSASNSTKGSDLNIKAFPCFQEAQHLKPDTDLAPCVDNEVLH